MRAFLRPAHKLFYNLTDTSLSVFMTLSIGVIVLVRLWPRSSTFLHWSGWPASIFSTSALPWWRSSHRMGWFHGSLPAPGAARKCRTLTPFARSGRLLLNALVYYRRQ